MGTSATGFRVARRGLYALRDERGFTLIETILSLSILVVMIGLVLSSLRLGQKSWEKGEEAIEDAAARRFIVKRLSADVGSMYLYIQNNNGRDTYIFKAGEKELGFVTTHHSSGAGMPWGGAMFVVYSVGEKGLTITEKTVPVVESASEQTGRSVELDADISGVRFSYLGENGWGGRWNMESIKRLPRAVRVEFVFRDDRRPLTVTVPVGVTYAPSTDDSAGVKGV